MRFLTAAHTMAKTAGRVIYEKGNKKIRYATERDYSSVVAIDDNVYEGLDYIPEQYFYYLNRCGTECFVMEVDNEMVGFTMATLIDEGKTLLVHGTRIHPAKKDLRSGLHFGGVCSLHVLQANPQVTSVVATSRPELDNVQKRQAILLLHDIPFELNTLMFRTGELYTTNTNASEGDIWRIEGKAMKTWLLTHGKTFFHDYIQLGYYPFKYLPRNIDIIVDEMKPVCFISSKGNEELEDVYKGVSFHVIHGTLKRGLMCIFHYYGDCIKDFEKHLKHHLNYLKISKTLKEDEELHLHCNFQQVFTHKDVTLMAKKFHFRGGLMRPATMLIQVIKDFEQTKMISAMLSKL